MEDLDPLTHRRTEFLRRIGILALAAAMFLGPAAVAHAAPPLEDLGGASLGQIGAAIIYSVQLMRR